MFSHKTVSIFQVLNSTVNWIELINLIIKFLRGSKRKRVDETVDLVTINFYNQHVCIWFDVKLTVSSFHPFQNRPNPGTVMMWHERKCEMKSANNIKLGTGHFHSCIISHPSIRHHVWLYYVSCQYSKMTWERIVPIDKVMANIYHFCVDISLDKSTIYRFRLIFTSVTLLNHYYTPITTMIF